MSRLSVLWFAAALAAGVPIEAEEPPMAIPSENAPTDPVAAQKKKGAEFLAKVDAEKGVRRTPSGLRIRIVQDGDGSSPSSTDTVRVHYRGTLVDGTEFDSSYKRDVPATFPLIGVIACWTEGLQLVKSGGKATLYCPSEIAYGDKGFSSLIPPGATLVFDVELLGIEGPNEGAAVSPSAKTQS